MKRIFGWARTQGGALAGALVLLVTGSGFALLHALGDSTITGVIVPLFATV